MKWSLDRAYAVLGEMLESSNMAGAVASDDVVADTDEGAANAADAPQRRLCWCIGCRRQLLVRHCTSTYCASSDGDRVSPVTAVFLESGSVADP